MINCEKCGTFHFGSNCPKPKKKEASYVSCNLTPQEKQAHIEARTWHIELCQYPYNKYNKYYWRNLDMLFKDLVAESCKGKADYMDNYPHWGSLNLFTIQLIIAWLDGFEFKFNKALVKLPLLADAQTRNYDESVMKVLSKSEQRKVEAFL